jgi:hypothetical protein
MKSSKLSAEGAIQNLMNILHCSKHDMDQFWNIVTSPVHLIQQALAESSVPKAVVKFGVECDSIQKSLWILPKKITIHHYKCAPNQLLPKLATSN